MFLASLCKPKTDMLWAQFFFTINLTTKKLPSQIKRYFLKLKNFLLKIFCFKVHDCVQICPYLYMGQNLVLKKIRIKPIHLPFNGLLFYNITIWWVFDEVLSQISGSTHRLFFHSDEGLKETIILWWI